MKVKYWILMLVVALAGIAGGVAISQEVETVTTTEWVQICYSLGSDKKTFTEIDFEQLTSTSGATVKCASGLSPLTIEAIKP